MFTPFSNALRISSVLMTVLIISGLTAFAAPASVGGVVKSASAAAKRITVMVGKGDSAKEQVFAVSEETKITLDGKGVPLDDLAEGTKVTISYDRSSKLAAVIRGTATKGEAPEKAAAPKPKPSPKRATGGKPPVGNAAGTGTASGDWPQFRGPNRDGISHETGLLKKWPQVGPPLAWRASGTGQGFSSVSVAAGRIYTMGNVGNDECVIALDVNGGKPEWTARIGRVRANGSGYAGPRCIPTVDGDLLYALGLNGDLVCLETAGGKERWRVDFQKDFGGRMMSGWGYSESPLVDGDRVICTPGGDRAALAALDKQTGKIVWTAPGSNTGGAAYSSIVIAEVGGIKQYVQLLGRGVYGVAAEDGKILWNYGRIANGTANIPTPLVHDDFVFCTTGYNDGGSALLKLAPNRGAIRAEEKYYLSNREFQNHHGGLVMIGDYIYGGHGHNNGLPTCLDWKRGKIMWGKQRGPGNESAAVCYADGHMYFRYQDGVMALIEATPERYNLKSTFRIPGSGTPSWPHPVIAGGRLYLRDQNDLLCYDVREK